MSHGARCRLCKHQQTTHNYPWDHPDVCGGFIHPYPRAWRAALAIVEGLAPDTRDAFLVAFVDLRGDEPGSSRLALARLRREVAAYVPPDPKMYGLDGREDPWGTIVAILTSGMPKRSANRLQVSLAQSLSSLRDSASLETTNP